VSKSSSGGRGHFGRSGIYDLARRLDVSVDLATIDLGHKRLDVREIMHAHGDEAAGPVAFLPHG
jgi:hypothetical protein